MRSVRMRSVSLVRFICRALQWTLGVHHNRFNGLILFPHSHYFQHLKNEHTKLNNRTIDAHQHTRTTITL